MDKRAVGAVGAAALLLAGCGTVAGAGGEGLPKGDGSAAVEHASTILTRIHGGATEQGAANFLVNFAANVDTQSCMADHGREWPFYIVNRKTNAVPTAGLAGSELLAPVDLHVVSDALLRTASAVRAEKALDDEKPRNEPGYQEQLTACLEHATENPPTFDFGQNGTPPTVDPLMARYWDTVLAVEDQLTGYQDQYTECMAEHGHPGLDGYHALIRELQEAVPKGGAPVAGEEPTAAWQEYLEHEAQTLTVDGRCRADALAEGLPLLAGAMDQFENDHGADLDRVEASWRDVVRQAKDLGYRPGQVVQVIG